VHSAVLRLFPLPRSGTLAPPHSRAAPLELPWLIHTLLYLPPLPVPASQLPGPPTKEVWVSLLIRRGSVHQDCQEVPGRVAAAVGREDRQEAGRTAGEER